LEAKLKSENREQAEEDEDALEIKKDQLKKVNKDNGKLQASTSVRFVSSLTNVYLA